MSRRRKKEKKPALILRLVWHYGWHPGRVMREVLEWAEVIVVAVGLAVLIMTFITVRMHVPTDSMYPTINGDQSLLKADSFFVDRITYYFRDPKPGDIVVFRHTWYIRIQSVEDGSAAEAAAVPTGVDLAYVNAEEAYTAEAIERAIADVPVGTNLMIWTADGQRYDLGPKPEGAVSLEDFGIQLKIKTKMWVKRLIAVGGQTVQIVGGDVYVDGEKLEGELFDRYYYSNDDRFQYGIEPTLVPEGCFFMLGDNSGNSLDSRYWGFVARKDIVGVPYLRVWPLSRISLM